ncbi:MAG: aspartate kinase [Gammaproteobacteria bacterium]|nr:aspartate kinase [Gammaproteobacteria bacterium]
MTLIVAKFGGTSVANVERIKAVADIVIATRKRGHQIVVVLSAMAGETDRLIELAGQAATTPDSRELDVLLSTGEQVTIALLSMALQERDYPAVSYTGGQVQILTDNVHNKARIIDIESARVKKALTEHKIVVIAGFQGIDESGNITTLGRGGTDTTAVAMAVALNAHECRIYTDVDGVYTADPRIVPAARRMDRLAYEEMLELSSLGAKVLQIRSVEFANKYKVPLRVLSSFEEGRGTLITDEDEEMERALIAGIAHNRDEAKLTLRGVPDRPGIAGAILGPIAEAGIEVDMIVQNTGVDHTTDFTFTVHRNDFAKATVLLGKTAQELGAAEVLSDDRIVKISVVGVGMRSHAGIASKMFSALAAEGINIQMISTSEIKISVVVDEKYLELGVRTLHSAFGLENGSAIMNDAVG